jgi:O-antigen/teichoic acid export membrane protein
MPIQKTKKLITKAINNKFISSSGIILAVNLINALCNYLLVVYVSYQISGKLSQWTALTGLITILSSPIVGANLEMSRKVSALEKDQTGKGYSYLAFLKKIFWSQGSLVLLVFSVAVLFGSLLLKNADEVQVAIYWLVGLVLYTQLQSGTSTQFLIGVIETKKAGLAMVFNGVGRFFISVLLIYFGFGILSLPLGLIGSFALSLLVASLFIKNLEQKIQNKISIQLDQNFHPLKEFLVSSKTIASLSILSLILYSTTIIAENLFPSQASDLFAVIFNFGQITHFGSTAFMSVFMAHATRSKNLLEYKLAIGVSSAVSICVGLVFGVFGSSVLSLFNRTQYTPFIPLILLYTGFILVYNAIFINTQFLLAKKAFNNLTFITTSVVAMLMAQFGVAWFYSQPQISFDTTIVLRNYILTSLFFATIILSTLFFKIKNLQKSTNNQ